jgi:Bacteriophage protein GP30.3
MNISYRSKNPQERILSNLAATPFTIVIEGQEYCCKSVEGFWQGLKCRGPMREHVFQLTGFAAKKAGKKKAADAFEIAGLPVRVGSSEHEELIKEAIRQKVLQNPKVAEALRGSRGQLTHNVPGRAKPIFAMEKLLMAVRKELWGH